MSEIQTVPVDTFAPKGNEADKLLAYPFAKPDGSYLTNGDLVITMPNDMDSFVAASDIYLSTHGLPLMSERVPIVEFGSNSSPFQTHEKMAKFGGDDLQGKMQTIPKLAGVIPDTIVVWHAPHSQKGSAFADAYKGEDSRGAEADCTIAFMDQQQLAVMHTTEGTTYEVARVQVLAGSNRQLIEAYAYVAADTSILVKDGKPVLVKRAGEAIPEAMTAEQAVDFMLDSAGDELDAATARDLIDQSAQDNLKGRRQRVKNATEILTKRGISREYSYPERDSNAIGRADFSTIMTPHVRTYRLMEQVVEALRPDHDDVRNLAAEFEGNGTKPALALKKARARLDIAHVLRSRAFEELKRRTGLTETILKK